MNEQNDQIPNQGVYTKKDKALRVISKILRWAILAWLLIFVVLASILHVLGNAAPSTHAICPYGGLESALTIITLGTFIKKIFLGTFIMFIITVALAVLMRRSYCGQICAFGGLQEFFGKLGEKIFKKRPAIPHKLDRVLRYLKYVVLVVTIVMAWITAELWITPYDPYNALGHLADFNALLTTYLVGFIVLILTILGSIVYDRFFCKYLCPVGALYGVIGKASPYAVRLNSQQCIQCGICNKTCPMNVDVMGAKNGKVTDIECINCNVCVNACPKKGALAAGFGKKARVHPLIATILAVAIFFIPIAIGRATGVMQMLPNKFENTENVSPHEEGEETSYTFNGVSSEDIKGFMTVKEVAEILGMPLEALYEKLGLDKSFPEQSPMKSAALSLGKEFSELKAALFN